MHITESIESLRKGSWKKYVWCFKFPHLSFKLIIGSGLKTASCCQTFQKMPGLNLILFFEKWRRERKMEHWHHRCERRTRHRMQTWRRFNPMRTARLAQCLPPLTTENIFSEIRYHGVPPERGEAVPDHSVLTFVCLAVEFLLCINLVKSFNQTQCRDDMFGV